MRTPRTPLPLLAILWIGLLGAPVAYAQALRETTALRFAPANASFFSTSLRLRESFDKFTASRAFAKLREMPMMKEGLGALRSEWEDGDLSEVREFFADEANQELLAVLRDGVSQEVFVYGDALHGKWLGTLGRLSNEMNLAQMQAVQRGEDPEEAGPRAIVDLLEKNPALLHVPSTVIGLRISDSAAVERQLARLEAMGKQLLGAELPEFADRLSRQTIGETNYLVLKLDGSMVPWDEVMEDGDLDPEVQDQLVKKLSPVTMQVSLGVFNGYLILAFGENDQALQQLGNGELLVDHAKLQPLHRYFDREVTGVAYASEEFMRGVSGVEERMNQMRDLFKTMVAMVPLDETIKTDLSADADLFFQQAIELQPKIGAIAAVSYAIPTGYESVAYNWTEHKALDGSQPLTILDHVGGDPIGFYAMRGKGSPEDAAFISHWSVKLGEYVERIGKPFLDSQQEELYEEIKKVLLPLGERLVVATRDQMAPGFADGQMAVVLDAQTSKKQWHMAMPPADEPVPLPELALVWSVTNADQVKAGGTEYLDTLQAAITGLSEILPDQIPPLELPRPQTRELPTGELFYYPIPPFLGLDPAVAPNAGLSASYLVLSIAPAATERLLSETPLQRSGMLASAETRALAYAWQFQMHRLVDMVRPWVAYGFQVAKAEGTEDPEVEMQVQTVLEVLSCLRNWTAIGYVEGEAIVTHSRVEYQDVAP